MNGRRNRTVARQRFAAPAKDHRIACLQANRRDVARHVGPRLVHDADDAQRHAPLRYGEAVGARDPVELLPNRIGETCDGLDVARHAGDALRRQPQAIDLDARGRIGAVLRIGGKDLCLARANGARDRGQRPILEIGRRLREHDRRRLRARRFVDQLVCRHWHSLIPNP